MARVKLDRRGVHPGGHEAFEVGIDRPVVLRHRIEGRFDPPSCLCHFPAEQLGGHPSLHGVQHLGPRRVDVLGEVLEKRLLTELGITICGLDKARTGRRRRESLSQSVRCNPRRRRAREPRCRPGRSPWDRHRPGSRSSRNRNDRRALWGRPSVRAFGWRTQRLPRVCAAGSVPTRRSAPRL
jgi:hypothetical protein